MALIFDAVNGFRDTGTGALGLPSGTTGQRPANPYNGYMRFNTDLGIIETYLPSVGWGSYSGGTYSAEILLVAGGGGGFGHGGGGAGGILYSNTVTLSGGTTYVFTVGAGGVAGTTVGGNSYHGALNALGGGMNSSGGSGSGSNGSKNTYGPLYTGTTGQGNPGGRGYYHNDDHGHHNGSGGSGGGAGSPGGGNGTSGGVGITYNITGNTVHYAGGGGSGAADGRGSAGGSSLGGGGHGGHTHAGPVAGSSHLGGGGGGGHGSGANGGSGVIVLKYISPTQRGIGGVVTTQTVSTVIYQIHTFNSTTNYIA
jgi:hypothetical protein